MKRFRRSRVMKRKIMWAYKKKTRPLYAQIKKLQKK